VHLLFVAMEKALEVFCLCCTWRKNKRPLYSVAHRAAEKAFGDAIAQLVRAPRDVCAVIRALDGQVQHGTVRRQAAGFLASRLYPAFSSIVDRDMRALMRIVARHGGMGCDCLHRVLDWGCCPTVIRYYGGKTLTALTARGLCYSSLSRPMLSAHGSLPWDFCKLKLVEPSYTRVVMQSVFRAQFPSLPQWRQWHGRRGRRLWTSVCVSL
jgi:hypothetical protein